MHDLEEQFRKDTIGKDNFENEINSLGQTFAAYKDWVSISEHHDRATYTDSNNITHQKCFEIGESK